MPDEQKAEPDYLPDGQQITKELKQAENTGFDKSKRLLNSRQYQHVLRQGRTYRNPLFIMVSKPNTRQTGRLGITVSKKVSKRAVDRNRLKRLIRESFRKLQLSLPNNDFIIIARSNAAHADNRTINHTLTQMWNKLARQ